MRSSEPSSSLKRSNTCSLSDALELLRVDHVADRDDLLSVGLDREYEIRQAVAAAHQCGRAVELENLERLIGSRRELPQEPREEERDGMCTVQRTPRCRRHPAAAVGPERRVLSEGLLENLKVAARHCAREGAQQAL